MKNKKHKLLLELSYETNKECYLGHGKPEPCLLNTIETVVIPSLVHDGVENFKIKKAKKLFSVNFEGINPVGNCLVLMAKNLKEAEKIAKETITHTSEFEIEEVDMKKSGVVIYLSGDF